MDAVTDGHPAKRQRVDDADSTTDTQRGNFWLDDGNVILQTQSDAMQFRVHRSVLAKHSPLFRDMFTLPQPLHVDGTALNSAHIPVIHVDDTAQDLEIFLEQLYGNAIFPNQKLTMAFIGAILRLAIKYEVDPLRTAIQNFLAAGFPTGFSSIRGSLSLIAQYLGRAFDFVNLLTSTGCRRFLPVAFLYASSYTVSQILNGFIMDVHGKPKTCILTPENIHIVLVGREALIREQSRLYTAWYPVNTPSCECNPTRKLRLLQVATPDSVFRIPPPEWDNKKWEKYFCGPCIAVAATKWDEGRQELWGKLPSFFGLPEWDVLLKDGDEE